MPFLLPYGMLLSCRCDFVEKLCKILLLLLIIIMPPHGTLFSPLLSNSVIARLSLALLAHPPYPLPPPPRPA